jgi:aminoglycoside phosphotransferase (APT) family kinase protein
LTAGDGAAVARFLRALHETPEQVYADTGVPSADESRSSLLRSLADLRERILPMLPVEAQPAASALLNDVAAPGPTCLVHGDLGPDHLLVEDGRVCGVIDWSDTVVGDPGLDLAWALHGTPAGFAESLAASYDVTPVLRARALLWHRLGPWWEALGGADFLGPATLASGLAGILARLGPPS